MLSKQRVQELLHDPKAMGTEHDYQDLTNPKYVGPGTWSVIHQKGWNSRVGNEKNDYKEQRAAVAEITQILEDFPCPHCREHALEYLKKNPMAPFIKLKIQVEGKWLNLGILLWTHAFHNTVNRVKPEPAPEMSWETCVGRFTHPPAVCSALCSAVDGEKKVPSGPVKPLVFL